MPGDQVDYVACGLRVMITNMMFDCMLERLALPWGMLPQQ
jgi:hypothetical protein